jgi:hypothetical protein
MGENRRNAEARGAGFAAFRGCSEDSGTQMDRRERLAVRFAARSGTIADLTGRGWAWRRSRSSITRRRTESGLRRIIKSRGPVWVESARRAKREDSRWSMCALRRRAAAPPRSRQAHRTALRTRAMRRAAATLFYSAQSGTFQPDGMSRSRSIQSGATSTARSSDIRHAVNPFGRAAMIHPCSCSRARRRRS